MPNLSCDILVASERYIVFTQILDEKWLLIHHLKSQKSRAKFYEGIFLETDSEWKVGGSNLTEMVLWQHHENEIIYVEGSQ